MNAVNPFYIHPEQGRRQRFQVGGEQMEIPSGNPDNQFSASLVKEWGWLEG